MRSRIPFTVIGGFLGAGKTTAINAILSGAGNRRIAVLVNDFGDLGVDAALIAQRNATTISLTNGCVCCTLSGGLTKALIDVLERDPPPEHIVVEASGVSDPRRIAQFARADPALLQDATIVLLAADQWPALVRDRHVADVVAAQIAAADFLILNKVDLVDETELASQRSRLLDLAPRARLLEATRAQLPCELLLGHAMTGAVAGSVPAAIAPPAETHAHASQFASRVFRADAPLHEPPLRRALEHLPQAVLRAKGFVRLAGAADSVQLVQVVGSRWMVSAFDADDTRTRSELVVVGPASTLADADLSALAEAFGVPRTQVGGGNRASHTGETLIGTQPVRRSATCIFGGLLLQSRSS